MPRSQSGLPVVLHRSALHGGRTSFMPKGSQSSGRGHRLWDYAFRGDVKLNPDDANEAALIDVLDTFCLGFARRDPEAELRVCAPDLDLVVVTSEEPLLRGPRAADRSACSRRVVEPGDRREAVP